MKLNRLVAQLAVSGLAAHLGVALAQTDTGAKLERVEVTGSSIKRVQDEGALPVQTLKAADLARLGVTTAEQLLQQLSANGNGIDNLASNQGGDFTAATSGTKPHNNGSSAASLRGLGSQYTLVLLNGRRLSTHGLNGQSVDLNGIPLAALDRVEVLKDGASAIYGTDAIGGVINFILKKDYTGLEVSASTDQPQHGGGNISRASVLLGTGNLTTDKFNLMAALTYDDTQRLRGKDRSFQNGIQPDRGLFPDTTGTPYANIGVAGGTALASTKGTSLNGFSRVSYLALNGKCDSVPDMYAYRGDVTGNNAFNKACAYDYGKQWSLMQPVQNTNFVGRGTVALNADTTAFIEAVASRSKSMVEYTEIQLTSGAYNYPSTGPYYQNLATLLPAYFRLPSDTADGRAVFDPSKPERIRWRCLPCGPRQQETTTDTSRVLAGIDGLFAGWDYRLGASAAQSEANTVYGAGNMLTNKLIAAMGTGKINPFLLPGQSQTAEAMQLIGGASARGQSLYGGKASVTQLDGVMSKEVFDLPGGKAAAAVGFDVRRENYRFTNGQPTNTEPVNGVTSVPSLDRVSRNISSPYTASAATSARCTASCSCRSRRRWTCSWPPATTTTATLAAPPTRRPRCAGSRPRNCCSVAHSARASMRRITTRSMAATPPANSIPTSMTRCCVRTVWKPSRDRKAVASGRTSRPAPTPTSGRNAASSSRWASWCRRWPASRRASTTGTSRSAIASRRCRAWP